MAGGEPSDEPPTLVDLALHDVPPPRYSDHDPSLTSWANAFIADKPRPIQERVTRLFNVQNQYTRIMMQYQEEAIMLERKYHVLTQSLNEERKEIVTGMLDPAVASPSASRGKERMVEDGENGIPAFWLQAMKNEPSISDLIAPRDEAALGCLRDIKIEFLPEGTRGFMIIFAFGPNEWFWNESLRKTYIYTRTADSGDEEAALEDIYGSDYTYHQSLGDVIDWKEGRNLVEEKEEDDDGEQMDSFFLLFESPQRPDGGSDEEMRKFQWLLELDFDYGELFKDKVIPYAVHWYTGEAKLYEDDDDDDDDVTQDDGDSDEDEEEEDEDDDKSD